VARLLTLQGSSKEAEKVIGVWCRTIRGSSRSAWGGGNDVLRVIGLVLRIFYRQDNLTGLERSEESP